MTRKPDPPDDDRKERVIHTRVPERLETELRERAQGLGISVSNLVRNVLGHAFGLVGDIMADGASVARAARGDAAAAAAATPSAAGAGAGAGEMIGWQPLVMGKNAVCDHCNAIIARGSDAAIAITSAAGGGGARPVICATCLEELRHGEPGVDDRSPKRSR